MSPDLIIKSTTADLTEIVKSKLIKLSVTDERSSRASNITFSIDNSDGFQFPGNGTDLILYLGYKDKLNYIGQYTVDDVELSLVPAVLSVRATGSRLRSSYRQRRDYAYFNTNLKSVIETIARRNQFEPRVSAALAGFPVASLVQRNQSDSSLMSHLAERFGVTISPLDGKLVGVVGGNGKTVSDKTITPINIDISAITSGNVNFSGRQQYQGARASYYDTELARKIWVVEGDKNGRLIDLGEPFINETEARKAAQSVLLEKQRRNYTLQLKIPGNTLIRFDSLLNLTGHPDPRVSATWRVIRVQHSLSARAGLVTSIEAAAPKTKPAFNMA